MIHVFAMFSISTETHKTHQIDLIKRCLNPEWSLRYDLRLKAHNGFDHLNATLFTKQSHFNRGTNSCKSDLKAIRTHTHTR